MHPTYQAIATPASQIPATLPTGRQSRNKAHPQYHDDNSAGEEGEKVQVGHIDAMCLNDTPDHRQQPNGYQTSSHDGHDAFLSGPSEHSHVYTCTNS